MVAGGLIPKPLEWDTVLENTAKAAPLLKKAYEKMGSKPDASTFTATNADDIRGLPTWEQSRWSIKN
jgi:hypothetical protein